MRIVCKFGGTSLSSPYAIAQAGEILRANSSRTVCVVSAPGVYKGCAKVTDLLYQKRYEKVICRLEKIIQGLDLNLSLVDHAKEKLEQLIRTNDQSAIISFGEYMSAKIFAAYLGWKFVDAVQVIQFYGNEVSVDCRDIENDPVIIPGFYGRDVESGGIRLFPRGGSDISAAYIAKAISADVYENWTDVSGVFEKDPRENIHAVHIPYLRYGDLARIVLAGAQVFHYEAIAPAADARIPVAIRNTFSPHDRGTIVF